MNGLLAFNVDIFFEKQIWGKDVQILMVNTIIIVVCFQVYAEYVDSEHF